MIIFATNDCMFLCKVAWYFVQKFYVKYDKYEILNKLRK